MDESKLDSYPDSYDFKNKVLIGLGSNGNRVYRLINKYDNKVNLSVN